MADLKDAKSDWAWFQIRQNEAARTLTLMRMADPHHRTTTLDSAAYLDAAKIEKAYQDSVTAKDNKIFRYGVPGKEALALAGVLADLENCHTYIVSY